MLMLTAFPFFSPFLFIAETRPKPSFFNPQAFQPPKQIFLVSCIFLIILIPIASIFWITPLIWWVGRLAELWGGRWRHFCRHPNAQIPRRRRRTQGQGGGNVYVQWEGNGT
jgi:hypothetical protein